MIYIVLVTKTEHTAGYEPRITKEVFGLFTSFQKGGDYVLDYCRKNPTTNVDGSNLTCELLPITHETNHYE